VIEGKLALGGLSLEFGGSQKRFDELSAKVEELAEHHEQLLDEQGSLFEELEEEVDRRQDETGALHGLVPALQADAEAQRGVVEARQRLHEAAERRDALAAELRAVESHRGRPYEEAIDMHEDFLQSQSVMELEEAGARDTGPPRRCARPSLGRRTSTRGGFEQGPRRPPSGTGALGEADRLVGRPGPGSRT